MYYFISHNPSLDAIFSHMPFHSTILQPFIVNLHVLIPSCVFQISSSDFLFPTKIYNLVCVCMCVCMCMCVCVHVEFAVPYTGLFKMIVGVLTTCHTQHTWDSSICLFLFNRTTLQFFVTYLTGALYVNPLWFYKHQHDNRVRSKLFRSMSAVMVTMAVLIRTFSSGILAGRGGT